MLIRMRRFGSLWVCILSLSWLANVYSQTSSPTSPLAESSREDPADKLEPRESESHSTCKSGDQMEVPFLVKPFDEAFELPKKTQGKLFHPIGHVRPINTRIASPRMFSACFTISTQLEQHSEICLELDTVELTLVRTSDRQQLRGRFHFDLCKFRQILTMFDPDRRTIVVIPGFRTKRGLKWQQEIADHWLKLEDVNVIQVHWPEGNSHLVYEFAAANVQILARQIIILLYYLASLKGRSFTSYKFRRTIHLVGHSLGAHVAGFVGKELGGQADRITALDPAGPIFDLLPDSERLTRTDAKFVAVIHTNAGKMKYLRMGVALIKKAYEAMLPVITSESTPVNDTPGIAFASAYEDLVLTQTRRVSDTDNTAWFGFERPLGHMDYYANGGSIQPGCQDELHICDHGRAIHLYIAFLKRELAERNYFGWDSRRARDRSYRLFAFRSREYAAIQSGREIHSECADFLLADSYGDARRRAETQKLCTVPLDFISIGQQLYIELTKDYKLNLSDTSLERRYYFETLNEEPFVAEQLLMRIHMKALRSGSPDWSDGCRLISLIRPSFRESAFFQVDYRRSSGKPLVQNGFKGFIIPVAKTNDWTNLYLTTKTLEKVLESTSSHKLLVRRLLIYLAPYLVIKLVYNGDDPQGYLSYYELGDYVKCEMFIDAIELRSLGVGDAGTNLTLWYSSRITNSANNKQIVVDSQEIILRQKKELMDTSYLSNVDEGSNFFLSAIGIGDQPDF